MSAIDISEEHGVRYLHFGSPWVQGAMRIARPWALELEYTREMMLPLLLHSEPAWPRTVLQVGLGAASLTKFVHRHRPEARMIVVEIQPEVVAAARHYFGMPEESRRLRVVIGDGREYMATRQRPYDLVLVDGYDGKGGAGELDSLPFYVDCRARLGPRGILCVNLLTRRKGVGASVERMRQAFDGRVLALPPSEDGNVIALAAGGEPVHVSLEDLRLAADDLKAATGLDLRPTLARLARGRRRAIAL